MRSRCIGGYVLGVCYFITMLPYIFMKKSTSGMLEQGVGTIQNHV